jgi:hypothetical protein
MFVQRGDLPIKGAHVAYQFGGQPFSSPLCSVAGTSPAQEFGGCTRRETLGYTLREEIPQQDMQAVEGAGALGHQVLTPLAQQPKNLDVALRSVFGMDPSQTLVS